MKKNAVMVAFLLCIGAVAVCGLASEPSSAAGLLQASALDSDADGLEDALELQIGTDPRLSDTDGDGLSDYDEYCKYCTDPAKPDSDGDGTPDSDWKERREYTYTISALCEIRPPNQVGLMSDLYQDARRVDQGGHHKDSTVVEVLIFPLATPHVAPQPYPALSLPESVAGCTDRTLAFNYSPQMQQQVQAIVSDAKTDVAAVEKIVRWIQRETRVVNTLPEFGYFHVKNDEIIWDRHLGSMEEEQRLLQSNFYGDSMFKARAHGTCSSIATLQVTMLRAAGLPARLIQTLPLINRYEADPEPLVDRMRRRIYAQGYEWGLGGGGANHMYTEIWLNGRWVRVDRSVGTGPMVGNKLFVKVFSAADWNNLYPARAPSDWDNENRDFRTLDVADAEPRHASRFPPMFKLAVGKEALSVKRQADGRFQAVVAIHNAGTDRSPEFAVWFYAGDPAKGGRLLAQHAAGPIMPSDTWNEGTSPFELEAGEREVFVVIDPKGRVQMSGKTPIQVSQDVADAKPRHASGSPSMFNLAVGKDALFVKRQADGRFQAWVAIHNEGTDRSPEFAVWFYAGDPAKGGRLLAKHAAGPIPPFEAWNEGTSPFELKAGEREVFVVLDPEGTLAALQHNLFTRNSAWHGGGVYGCNGLIQDSTFTANSARDNGGGLAQCHGTIRSNIITGNQAFELGGGLAECHGLIENNRIQGNLGYEGGGGVYGCDGVVRNNWVESNTVHEGGGGGFASCLATIQNNLILRNSASYGGGLSRCLGSVQNNTIFGNSAGAVAFCTNPIVNCIIWGNWGGPNGETLYMSAVPSHSCIQAWTGGGDGNIASDPQFVNSTGNDFWVLATSPCIDMGDNSAPNLVATDFLGRPRILYGGHSPTVDLGPYELWATACAVGPQPDQVTLRWGSLEGKTYTVFYSVDLFTWQAVNEVPAAGNLTTSWIHDGSQTGSPPGSVPCRFYRWVEHP